MRLSDLLRCLQVPQGASRMQLLGLITDAGCWIWFHYQKKPGEESLYLAYASMLKLSMREVWGGTQGRISEVGTNAEAIEECCFLDPSGCFLG